MNAIFTVVFIASMIALAFIAPDKLLPSLLGGAESAAQMALTLFCIYAVWMGLSNLAEKSGLSRGAAKMLKPLTRRIFKTQNDAAGENLAMNLSCNLLGLGGAATPYAVKAIGELEKENNSFAQKLLFVINATSVQILPTTVIALRASAGSISASDIFLPSLICTAVSTFTGVLLFVITQKIGGRRKKWR
ncbi:MAG: hypothetical protein K2H30_05415 [Clostridia bacterium]|nr:hypothetical protein [Clostridia bacterium]